MRGYLGLLVVIAMVIALGPAGASAWNRRGPRVGRAIAVGADAIVEGVTRRTPRHSAYEILRLRSSRTGRVLWQHKWRGPGPEWSDEVDQVAFASNGDVVAAGTMIEGDEQSDFVVRRLDGRTGRTLWHAAIHGAARGVTYENARTVAIAPDGSIVAAGQVNELNAFGHYGNFAVVGLDGATGRERWRWVTGGGTASGNADRVALDSRGDVIAAGTVHPDGVFGVPVGVTLVGLSGVTGALQWSTVVGEFFDVKDLVVDDDGDAYAAGTANDGSDFGVVKIDGVTGAVDWIARQSDGTGRWETAMRVRVDGDAVFAAGMTDDGTGGNWPGGEAFRVVRIDRASGDVVWSHRTGGGSRPGFATDLAIASDGSVVAAGNEGTPATCTDAFVTALDRTTGAPRWSETFDGTLATDDCNPDCGEHGPCPAADWDGMDALGVDAGGRIIVSGHLYGGTKNDAKLTSFLRVLDH